ncbi:hypothetical protein OHA10_11790 [Kribbella sp. NBC_00662]|uniref:hypothetical protein n=1 Tax=Kribbella sp. NBC_00662 TaxID=2975969 RepID=UPI003246B9C7
MKGQEKKQAKQTVNSISISMSDATAKRLFRLASKVVTTIGAVTILLAYLYFGGDPKAVIDVVRVLASTAGRL